jgi:tetratricopeptide (TPR) repeat protein
MMRQSVLTNQGRTGAGLIYLILLMSCAPSAFAAGDDLPQLKQAQDLSDRGSEAAAITILESLLGNRPGGLDDTHRGIALNILGSSHQILGDYEAAQHCYESAINLLKNSPSAEDVYVAALDNLGSLETLNGQLDAATIVRLKAAKIYRKRGDGAGLARTDDGLAMIALSRNNLRHARGFLIEAMNAARQAKNLGDADRADMYALQAGIAARDRDFATAVTSYHQSIGLWESAPRQQYDVVAWEHALLGDAYRELGNLPAAGKELREALGLLQREAGRSPIYFKTELLYAQLLRMSGDTAKAKQIKAEADAALDRFQRQQCNGCSVSIDSFR